VAAGALLTSPDVAEDVELAESVSFAMLTVLETLGPTERAVFVLREVFETPYDEIAEAVGKTPAECGRSLTAPGSTWPRDGHEHR
jgi:DNA-directed RNA polymerase specialized sigma24 family protein